MLENQEQLAKSMQRAHLPKRLSSFEETLRLARERRTQQRRALSTAAALGVVAALMVGLALSRKPTETNEPALIPLQAIKLEQASQPTSDETPKKPAPTVEEPQPAGETTTPAKKKEEKRGYLIVNTFPLIDLIVIVDGEETSYKTPVSGKGIALSPGEHTLYFSDKRGSYGPFKVKIEADTTTRERFDINPKNVSKLGNQSMNFDGTGPAEPSKEKSLPTPKESDGFLLIETKPSTKGLLVYINGNNTGYKTPVRGDGIRLAPGSYKVEFRDGAGANYGTFKVVVNESSTQKQSFKVEEPEARLSPIKDGHLRNPFEK